MSHRLTVDQNAPGLFMIEGVVKLFFLGVFLLFDLLMLLDFRLLG